MLALSVQACAIAPGKSGLCLARENQNGTLIAANYGQTTSAGMDPIEKKPLYHFHPGASILSLGSWGCNLKCSPACGTSHINARRGRQHMLGM